MFKPSTSVPKFGEIRLGCAPQDHALLGTHKYVGIHPYLVVSNDVYNKFSGQCDVIPSPPSVLQVPVQRMLITQPVPSAA